MKAKHYLLIYFLFTCSFRTQAQELNARVQLQAPAVPNIDKRNIDVLQTAVREFLNNTKWTAETYAPQERIACNFVITITEWDGNASFKAEAQLQSSRPIYGSSYNSTLLNISDKDFDFTFAEGQALDFSSQNFISNLSSLLGFYAYTIIGLDKDSFSSHGGTTYYANALKLVNLAQSSGSKGWKPSDGLRNRYWLNENLLNKNFNELRTFIYEYHVKGLDRLHENPVRASKEVLSIFARLKRLDKQRIGSIFPNSFLAAKSDEVVNIFSIPNIEPSDKIKAYNLLAEIDPANISKYGALRAN
jgi:hypothetical protein